MQEGQIIRCSGCERLCHKTVNACWQCNFFLHDLCASSERYIEKHPSHSQHPIVLIPKPTYCSGSFICNKCGETGSSFSYSCTLCEFDFHVDCAFLPLEVSHNSHQHELTLSKNIEAGPDEFCKICSKVLSAGHSFYYCNDCEVGTHIFCVINEVEPDYGTSAASGTTSVVNEPSAQEMIQELLNLQLQMQMTQGLVQMMASFNPSLN